MLEHVDEHEKMNIHENVLVIGLAHVQARMLVHFLVNVQVLG